MDLIDRYVYAVVKQLAEPMRKDVERELRANIRDMLPNGYSESDVRAALLSLGNPYRLADEYRGTKHYLIGPTVYDSYLTVLKLVTGIVISVLVPLTVVSAVLETPASPDLTVNLVQILWQAAANAIEGGMQAALWVTVSFVIFERTNLREGELPFSRKEWSLDNLPPVPGKAGQQIPRFEPIFAMAGIIFAAAILVLTPDLIGWYASENGKLVLVASLLNKTALQAYQPALLLVAATGLVVAGLKLVYGAWNLALGVSNAINNVLTSILTLTMVNNQQLFNSAFLTKMRIAFGVGETEFSIGWARAIWAFVGVAIVASVFDSVAGLYRGLKASRRHD